MPSTHDEWKVSVRQHPGSSQEDIKNEPNWGSQKHEHYIGFKNAQRRKPGLTSEDENWNAKVEEAQEAQRKFNTAKKDQQEGRLINFQDALRSDKVCCRQPRRWFQRTDIVRRICTLIILSIAIWVGAFD